MEVLALRKQMCISILGRLGLVEEMSHWVSVIC